VTENEAKEHARVPRPLRGFPARRRGGRSTRKLTPLSAGLRQSARFYPSTPPMLSAGQWEIHDQKPKNLLQTYFYGLTEASFEPLISGIPT